MLPNENEFNLTGIVQAWNRRWKTIVAFVVLSLAVCAIMLTLSPRQYEAKAVATAGNPLLSDKAHLFNQNIDQLYSNYGSGDDLDRLLGIATLDTTYKIIVDSFRLIEYYTSKGANNAIKRYHAVNALKKDLEIQKNELNQLTVTVWNKNPALAANIANSVISVTERLSGAAMQKSYTQSLHLLDSSITGLESKYGSLSVGENGVDVTQPFKSATLSDIEKNVLEEQIKQYRKVYEEISLAASNTQPALIILQAASPAAKAGKPVILLWMFGVFIASFWFTLLAVLLYDRKP